MNKQLIISFVLLCATHTALGQLCGVVLDTDLSGTFTSSTSDDECSGGGGHGILLTAMPADRKHLTDTNTLPERSSSESGFLFLSTPYSNQLARNFTQVDRLKSPTDRLDQIFGKKAAFAAPGSYNLLTENRETIPGQSQVAFTPSVSPIMTNQPHGSPTPQNESRGIDRAARHKASSSASSPANPVNDFNSAASLVARDATRTAA